MSSIWIGSSDAYVTWLHQHYKALLRSQKASLAQCSGVLERLECEAELARLQAEYKRKLRESRDII